MAKYDVYTTKKGTELPMINLKGKPYMQVSQRLVWFTEEVPKYRTTTEFLLLTDEQTIARVTVTLLDASGSVYKEATATKRETKKDFPDHTEKAETGGLGRALAMLGFGTQFAVADLDEGDRLADSPVTVLNPEEKVVKANPDNAIMSVGATDNKEKTTFSKKHFAKKETVTEDLI